VPKIVVTIHALKEQLPYWVYPTFAFLARWVDRFILEDRIALHQLLQLNVKRSKTLHIPIGIDILEESPLNNQFISIRQECNIPPECPLILNIARFHVRKGQDYLLRAMSQVIKEIPDTRLIIVGHGTELNKLKHLAKVLNLERHVMFLVNRSDLSNFFIASDLFVNSTLDEGMGVVIYQAMTCDKAVVAFNAGSINEVVVNGETGILVPVKDYRALAAGIVKLLKDNKLRIKYGRAGKKRIEAHFQLKDMVKKYEDVYYSLAEK
jgi:glycosyltransferase involved in cell wall biosynthesis